MSDFNLNMHTARLLLNEPFFAALSRRINKSASTAIPTAGVKVNPETATMEMLYNPEFFAKLTDEQRTDVLKHEFYHLIFEHVTGRLPEEGMSKLWNIATDLAINSHLNHLPEGCCMPGDGLFADLPKGKSAEWYFEKLKKMMEDEKKEQGEQDGDSEGEGSDSQDGSGDGSGGSGSGRLSDMDSMDDHSGWGEGESGDAATEIAKERLKDALKKAAHEASEAGSWGTVSAQTRKEIMDRLATKVDWRKVLRYFIKTSQKSNKRSTVRRINKRFPYIHAGKKVTRTAKIAISIDQSGSVSDKMLAAFFAELGGLAKYAEFTVVPFDTEVGDEHVFQWKKGKKVTWDRVLCGGTCFNAPTKWVNERQFDGHIVLTDMCAPKPIPSNCQRMWMTDRQGKDSQYFTTNERVIVIEP